NHSAVAKQTPLRRGFVCTMRWFTLSCSNGAMGPMRNPLLCLFAACIAALAGCGKDDDRKAATQVAAKVNSEEITVHQVNDILARNPNVTPELAPLVKREIVDRLIDQQLAKQQAIQKKLDRSPHILQAIEAAKSEILARAYLQVVAAAQEKPTPDE